MHRHMEIANGPDAVADPRRRDAVRGQDHERLLDVRGSAACLCEVFGSAGDGVPKLAGAVRVGGEVVTSVLDTERHMPGLVRHLGRQE